MTKIKGTTTLAKLLVEMGMDEQGGLPLIWDGSPVTHYHYYRKVVDAIASHNHQRVAIREHVRQEDLDRPIRILLTAGGAAAGGTDLESTQDFGLRQAEFRYDDGIRRTENKEYETSVSFIVKSIQDITNETTKNTLRTLINSRNAPNLFEAFQAMGITENPQVAFQAKRHLMEANFGSKSIEVVKAVIDQVRDVINMNNGALNPQMADTELRVILFDKAQQSDDSEAKDKFTHIINTIEQEIAPAYTNYEDSYVRLKAVSVQYDAKNNKGNAVDSTFSRYGLSGEAEEAKFTHHPGGKLECLGCGKDHTIDKCHSYYSCQIDKSKAHHIKEKCADPKCVQPKDKLKSYLEHIEKIKEKIKIPRIKKASLASTNDEASAPKIKRAKKEEAANMAVENPNSIAMAELLNSMNSSINQISAQIKQSETNYANLAGVVTKMDTNFRTYANNVRENDSYGLIQGHHNRRNLPSASNTLSASNTFNENSGFTSASQRQRNERNDNFFADQNRDSESYGEY